MAPIVADHRVEHIGQGRVAGAGPVDSGCDDRCGPGPAEISRQHGRQAVEHAECREAVDLCFQLGCRTGFTGEPAVPRVVREGDGVERPDLKAGGLDRRHRDAVADIAVTDPGLDR